MSCRDTVSVLWLPNPWVEGKIVRGEVTWVLQKLSGSLHYLPSCHSFSQCQQLLFRYQPSWHWHWQISPQVFFHSPSSFTKIGSTVPCMSLPGPLGLQGAQNPEDQLLCSLNRRSQTSLSSWCFVAVVKCSHIVSSYFLCVWGRLHSAVFRAFS